MTTTKPTPPAPTTYVVTFERIGRTTAPPPLTVTARDADELAGHVWRYARKYTVSRQIDVDVDTLTGRGWVYAGMRTAGSFTFTTDQEVTP